VGAGETWSKISWFIGPLVFEKERHSEESTYLDTQDANTKVLEGNDSESGCAVLCMTRDTLISFVCKQRHHPARSSVLRGGRFLYMGCVHEGAMSLPRLCTWGCSFYAFCAFLCRGFVHDGAGSILGLCVRHNTEIPTIQTRSV
jgi:hypothetical protein